MEQVICPLDNRPCAEDCPDRLTDREQGGCLLTTAQEQGATLTDLGGGLIAILFTP